MNPTEPPKLSSGRLLLDFPKWIHALAWGGVLAAVLLLVGVSRYYDGQNIWRDWAEAKELRQPKYAERIYHEDVLRTRANSWSNLAYVLVGFYAVGLAFHDSRRMLPDTGAYLIKTPALSILFGAACCYLGFGSGFFHASLTRWGQQLDVAAMYAPLLALTAISVGGWIPCVNPRAGQRSLPTWPILAGLVVFVSFLLYRYKWSMNSKEVLAVLILTSSVLAVADQYQRRRQQAIRWLVLGLVTMIFARLCWDLDRAKKFSGPEAWLQGHAVWHLLTALSLFSTYLFYRTEPRHSRHGMNRVEKQAGH